MSQNLYYVCFFSEMSKHMLAVGGGVSKETEEGGMKEFRENGREKGRIGRTEVWVLSGFTKK